MDSARHGQDPAYKHPVTLDGFIDDVSASEGIRLADLERLTTLLVHTANSRYRIIVLDGPRMLMQGGRYFPDNTTCDLGGSSFGDGPVKFGWIGVGMRMEIWSKGRRIITSPVRAITTSRNHSRAAGVTTSGARS